MANFTHESVSNQIVQPCEDWEPKDLEHHWIEIELVYEDNGEPVPGEEYAIVLPDGAEVRGLLNERGWARVNFISDPGNCEISFPKLDKSRWKAI